MKNNLAEDRTGLAYRVIQAENGAPVLLWDNEPVTVSADDALGPSEPDDERSEREQAADWLEEVLADGPASAKDLQHSAREAGHSWRTVQRAKRDLGVVVAKTDFSGGWCWSLPAKVAKNAEDGQAGQLAIFGKDWPSSRKDGGASSSE